MAATDFPKRNGHIKVKAYTISSQLLGQMSNVEFCQISGFRNITTFRDKTLILVVKDSCFWWGKTCKRRVRGVAGRVKLRSCNYSVIWVKGKMTDGHPNHYHPHSGCCTATYRLKRKWAMLV